MAKRKVVHRPHTVTLLLSDEEFAKLEDLRRDAPRTQFFRALLEQAYDNPETSPFVHKCTWVKSVRGVIAWQDGRPLFKFTCVCGRHKVALQRNGADYELDSTG